MKRILDFQSGRKGYFFGGLLVVHALSGLGLAFFNAPTLDLLGFFQANQAAFVEVGAGIGILATRRAVNRV